MPKRMIVTQPPPQPTPLFTGEKKAAKEAVDSMVRAARMVPGVEAYAVGDAIKVRVRANSLAEMAQKLMMLPAEITQRPSKTMCDGDPVRIT